MRIPQFICRGAIQLEAKFALANLINSLANLINALANLINS